MQTQTDKMKLIVAFHNLQMRIKTGMPITYEHRNLPNYMTHSISLRSAKVGVYDVKRWVLSSLKNTTLPEAASRF
jgi:hypothetical protein